MSMIQIRGLSFSYGAQTVFEDVDLTLDTDWKLGFTGRNGRGKTTFLKILAGRLAAAGKISANVGFEYFPYPAPYGTAEELFGTLAPDAQLWQIKRELFALGLDENALYAPFASLSEGEKTKTMIAAMFLKENAFLLVDEPTNHLDERGRETLAAYLRKKSGFIVVSHDRAFLDGFCDHILSLNRTGIEVRKGDFSAYLADKTAREDNERAENKRLRSEISALEQSARRTKEWGERVEKSKTEKVAGLKPDKGHVGAMAAKMMKRAKSTERQKERAAAEKRSLLKDAEFVGNLKLSPLPYRAETVCALSHVRVRYGEREVLSDFSLAVRRGEAVRLSGANGCGKSTVLRLLTGEIRCDAGEISRSKDLVISYLPQTLPDSPLTPARYAESLCADPALFLAILNKFDFKSELFGFPVASFSDGQKKKVALAASLSKSAHLYVWDEPLNFLDVISRMQIQELLLAYRPTLLFVEHDAAFCKAVATRTVEM